MENIIIFLTISYLILFIFSCYVNDQSIKNEQYIYPNDFSDIIEDMIDDDSNDFLDFD